MAASSASSSPSRPFEFQSRPPKSGEKSLGGAAAASSSAGPASASLRRPCGAPSGLPAMDSLPAEDLTLPLGFNGSVNFSQLPDVSGDEIRGHLVEAGALTYAADDTVSPTRARTMKDFENIMDLRKENFNLKLRIYFLEERIQQKFDGPNEDVYRINIELKVELESLKRELQERERLLIKASKALESLAQGGDGEIQRLKEEARKNIQQMEENLTSKINLLHKELKAAHEEAEKAFVMTERERVLRLAAEQQLGLLTNLQPKDLDVRAALEEKDRRIEELGLLLKSQEAAIQGLEEARSQRRFSEESFSVEKCQVQAIALVREKEVELEALRTEFCNQKNDLEKRIQSLQEELCAFQSDLSVEKKNALKRDKTIQGLTLALKAKESENEELASEIESLNVSLAKARGAAHKAQLQKYKGAEDSQVLLMEKESLLADLRSENLTKDTENCKLQKRIKRTEEELSDLHLEREKLVKELEEAQQQRIISDKTINDLRNQLEKAQGEMAEKEKAVEQDYNVLLSDSSQKLQSQEAIVAQFKDSLAQKDELLQKLDEVVKEKDVALEEWCAKFQSLLKHQEVLQKQNEDLVKEKCAQQLMIRLSQELEEAPDSQDADMLEVLRQEREDFSALIKSLKAAASINNLQEEVNNIIALRKQLEDDILANWHLRKVLEEQIKANRRSEESLSSWGDQTSYMSICLKARDYLVLEVDHLPLEELKKKIAELMSVMKELHLENEALRRKQLELSASEPLAKENQKTYDSSEFLESTEASQALMEAFEGESNIPIYLCPETTDKVIHSDYLDRLRENLNKPRSEREPAGSRIGSGNVAGEKYAAQEWNPPVSLLNENGLALRRSEQEQMEIANELLDHRSTPERDSSSDGLENKDEEDLQQLTVQPEIGKAAQGNKPSQLPVELQSTLEGDGRLDLEQMSPIHMAVEMSESEAKDTVGQTVALGSGDEGKSPGSNRDEGKSQGSNRECRQKETDAQTKQQETLTSTQKANKSDLCHAIKKSRLPVLLKPSRSLGSISSAAPSQKMDMHLQHRMFNLDEELKGRGTEARPTNDELPPSATEEGTSQMEGILTGAESFKLDDTEADVSLSSIESQDITSFKDQSTSQVEPSIKLEGSDLDLSLSSIRSDAETCAKDQDANRGSGTNRPKSNLPALKGHDQTSDVPTKVDADTTTTVSLLSLKLSIASVDVFDGDATDDVKELRQRIKDLTSRLAKYHALMVHFLGPAKELPPEEAIAVVRSGGELPADDTSPPMPDGSKHEPQPNSLVPQQVGYAIRVEDLASHLPEQDNEALVEQLQELLSENEAELEKEQIANMHLLDRVCRLQRRLKGALSEGSGSLLHVLVPEDAGQCEKIRECHSLCVTYRQHLTNLIRAFEELLQSSEVDYYVAEGFREQLNRSAQLFEHLEQQCLYGESIEDEMAQLGLRRSASDSETSQRSSLESAGQKETAAHGENEMLPVESTKFPPELLMEHLHEIRMLRHQLEESIKTNDRLRTQLEQQVLDFAQKQGPADGGIRGAEQHNSRASEIRFLREQNQLLNVMLAKGSQEKQKENEKLCESLAKRNLVLEQLRKDCEILKKENEKLQNQEMENGQLTHEVYNLRNELNRLQMELSTTQQQLTEKDNLLRSLQLEIKVYEKLDEAVKSQKVKISSDGSHEEGWKDQSLPVDLHELMTEIRTLRTQLEISIKTNQILHEKLEGQFSRGKGGSGGSASTVNIRSFFKQESQRYAGLNEFKFPLVDGGILELQQKYRRCISTLKADADPPRDPSDASSRCSSSNGKSLDSALVPRHCMWADKNGRHVLGSVEDYNSLRKQIVEGQKLLSGLELPLKDAAAWPEPGATVLHQAYLGRLSDAICTLHQNLDEATRLLKLLWRVSLPMKVVHSAAYSLQDESLRAEVHKLRRKVAEQEKKLNSTIKCLNSTSRLKENMEKVIIDHLALTHDVLRKARGNLELQPAENRMTAFSPGKKRVL